MARSNRPVTSREYKLILIPECFENRAEGAARFWELVESLLRQENPAGCERQNNEKRRLTWYPDTPDRGLERSGYTLRMRDEKTEEFPFKITLKYRHGDRYLAARRDVDFGDDLGKERYAKKESKFEEDVVAPFASKFSRSASICANQLVLGSIGQAKKVFPVLARLGLEDTDPLLPSGNVVHHEVMRQIGRFTLDGKPLPPAPSDPRKDPAVKAWLTFWYDGEDNDHKVPQIAEFSFDYEAEENNDEHELEEFAPAKVAGAERLWRQLQEHNDWVNVHATTKTAPATESLGAASPEPTPESPAEFALRAM